MAYIEESGESGVVESGLLFCLLTTEYGISLVQFGTKKMADYPSRDV